MNCTVRKQNVSNVKEKNDIKSVTKKKKAEKKYRSSSADDTDDSENQGPLLKILTKEIVNYLYQIVYLTEMRIVILHL